MIHNEKVIHRFAPIDTAPEMCYYCENFICIILCLTTL